MVDIIRNVHLGFNILYQTSQGKKLTNNICFQLSVEYCEDFELAYYYFYFFIIITNLLLTEREGRTGEYWPEVVTVRTSLRSVRTKSTEGQYSPVRREQARLVSSLLYGTLFLIVKCTSGSLHLKNVHLLHPSLKFRKNFNLFSFCW